MDSLLEEWIAYEAMMLPHLKEEEEIALPLMRAYFTKKDLKPVVSKLIKHSPEFEMGSIIHAATPETFRNDFMVQEGIPFFVWYIDFRFKHMKYQQHFVRNVECLKSGVPPADLASSSCVIL